MSDTELKDLTEVFRKLKEWRDARDQIRAAEEESPVVSAGYH